MKKLIIAIFAIILALPVMAVDKNINLDTPVSWVGDSFPNAIKASKLSDNHKKDLWAAYNKFIKENPGFEFSLQQIIDLCTKTTFEYIKCVDISKAAIAEQNNLLRKNKVTVNNVCEYNIEEPDLHNAENLAKQAETDSLRLGYGAKKAEEEYNKTKTKTIAQKYCKGSSTIEFGTRNGQPIVMCLCK